MNPRLLQSAARLVLFPRSEGCNLGAPIADPARFGRSPQRAGSETGTPVPRPSLTSDRATFRFSRKFSAALGALAFASLWVAFNSPAQPALKYSRTFGGNLLDQALAATVDSQGNVYVTGTTTSTDFPLANAMQTNFAGFQDAFVAKLNTNGAIVFSTYLGGSREDIGTGIALDTNGNIYVTGYTLSTNFPTANPLQATNGGNNDVFVAKLNPAGSALIYSTYLGGNNFDTAGGIAVDAGGNAIVTGYTQSTNFPTASAAQPGFGGIGDAFVAKLNANGSALIYSTYLGGSGQENRHNADLGGAVAVDAAGNAHVTGWTFATDFPVLNALQSTNAAFTPGSATDAFVAKFNPAGAKVYATYLGGSFNDKGRGIAVDAAGNAYVTGNADSYDFPIQNALQPALAGEGSAVIGDAFVTAISSNGASLIYSTFLGGTGDDQANGITVDAGGNVGIAGFTDSINFPLLNAIQSNGDQALLKSTDGAASWTAANSGLTSGIIKAIQLDPVNPTVLYCAPYQKGVFKSTDGGAHWTAANNGIDDGVFLPIVSCLAIHPQNTATVYAGGFRGVFKTTDGGTNWAPLADGLPGGGFPDVQSLAVDPVTPTTLYAGTSTSGAYKSVDGGTNWFAVNTGLAVTRVLNLLVDPQANLTVFAGGGTSSGTNLFKSTNGGTNWTRLVGGGLRAGEIVALAMSPTDSSTIYAVVSPSSGSFLLASSSGGITWTNHYQSASSFKFTALAVAPGSPPNLYLGTEAASGYGVLKSGDGGVTWNGAGLALQKITTLAVNPLNVSNIFAGLDGGRDSFLASLKPGGAMSFSTYLGGVTADESRAIAVDGPGDLNFAGFSGSTQFPSGSARFAPGGDPVNLGTAAQVAKSDAYVGKAKPAAGGPADLRVSLDVEPQRVGINDLVAYSAQINNDGPGDAANISVKFDFPSAGQAPARVFEVISGDCVGSFGEYSCQLAGIPAGARTILRLILRDKTAYPVQVDVTAKAATPDPNLANNSASITPAQKTADLSVSVSVDPPNHKPRDRIIFQIEVTNNGPDAAGDATVVFDLANFITEIEGISSPCTGSGGIFACKVGDIPPGGKVKKTLSGIAKSTAAIECLGSVSSQTPDPNGSNNTASVLALPNGFNVDFASPFGGVPGAAVTIKGSGFLAATGLGFNQTPAGFNLVNDSTIETVVPAGATTGPLAFNTATGQVASAFNFFVFGFGSQPVIGNLSATRGSVGSYVILTGANLTGASVSIGGFAASVDALRSSDSQIVFQIPPGAQTGKISVTTLAGTTQSFENFTVTACPGLTLDSTPPTLPHGVVGQDYFTTEPVVLYAVGGQQSDAGSSFTVAGHLPKGLRLFQENSMDDSVQITGTPRESGTFTFIVTFTDGVGCSVSRSFTLTIDAGASPQIAVTTSADSGPGSLREAIAQANATPGSTIFFCLPTSDPAYDPNTRTFKIQPTSPLPAITAPGTHIEGGLIDPATGNTADNRPNVIIDGALVLLGPGLQIAAADCVLQDLIFEHWTGDGVNCALSLELRGQCQFNENGGNGVQCGGSLTTESVICRENVGWGALCQGDLALNAEGHGVTGFASAQFCGKGGFCSTRGAVIGADVRVLHCGQGAANAAEGAGVRAGTFINLTDCDVSGNESHGCTADQIVLDGDCELAENGADGLHAASYCQIEDAFIHDNAGYGCSVADGDASINLGGRQSACHLWLNGAGGVHVPNGECAAFNLDCSLNGSSGIRCESVELVGCDLESNQGYGCEVRGGTCVIIDTDCVGNTLGGVLCTDAPQNRDGRKGSPVDPPGGGPAQRGGATNVLSGSLIASNSSDGLRYEQSRPLTIANSSVFANTGIGVNTIGSATVIARQNWWGAVSGPGGAGPGGGDEVSANVDFSLWRSAPVALTASAFVIDLALSPGEARSVPFAVRNRLATNDTVQAVFSDAAGWLRSVGAVLTLSNGFGIVAPSIVVPTNAAAGDTNRIFVHIVSLMEPAWTNSASLVVHVQPRLAPQLTVLRTSDSNAIALRVTGSPDDTCAVETSADLRDWTPLFRRRIGDSGFAVAEPTLASPGRRFYRVRVP